MDRAGSWLRGLTGLLVALNLGLFAVGMLVQNWPVQGFAPRNMNADEIRLAAALPPVAASTETAVASADAQPAEPTGESYTDAAKRCLAWSHLDSERVLSLDRALADAGLKPADYAWEADEKLVWWVYLPPLVDAAKLRAAVDQAHALGVTEAEPVRAGSLLNALSLGTFPSLDKARQHAALMTQKGLKGATYGLRPNIEVLRLRLVNLPDKDLTERLRQAARGLMPESCPASATAASSAQVSE